MYQGWTQELSEQERRTNELQAVRELQARYPQSAYWLARLQALEQAAGIPAALLVLVPVEAA